MTSTLNFERWWVSEIGRPPILGEQFAIEMARKAWDHCLEHAALADLPPGCPGQTGTPGVRDTKHPCDMFRPGAPTNGGCQGDGHYLCGGCVLLEKVADHECR